VKSRAKKATAGQRFVGIPDYCHTAEEAQAMVRAAQAIDRAIAAAVRKERRAFLKILQTQIDQKHSDRGHTIRLLSRIVEAVNAAEANP
jgi:hypothetical protein